MQSYTVCNYLIKTFPSAKSNKMVFIYYFSFIKLSNDHQTYHNDTDNVNDNGNTLFVVLELKPVTIRCTLDITMNTAYPCS